MPTFFIGLLAAVALAPASGEQPKQTLAPPGKIMASSKICVKERLAYAKDGKHSGCCSHHGGVCGCSGGRALCCDGAPSPTCGCD